MYNKCNKRLKIVGADDNERPRMFMHIQSEENVKDQ